MPDRVIMARIGAPFGVRGWIKVHSYAEPPESLLDFPVWQLGHEGTWQAYTLAEGHAQGGANLVVRFKGFEDRDQAATLRGLEVAVARQALAPLPEDEYYWADLVGLKVINTEGELLGVVSNLMETGANDVLVVKGDRERLIPYIRPDVVRAIDLTAGELHVDWEADF